MIGVPAFVMNAFAPSIRHPSPTSVAVVAASAASVPPPGSVSANDAIVSPAASAGSQRSFCASDPNREIMAPPSPTAADSVIATDWSTRPSSSSAMHVITLPASAPPYAAGNGRPNSPRSAIARTSSSGKACRSSRSPAPGAITSSAKARTTVRNARCSSVRSKSIR